MSTRVIKRLETVADGSRSDACDAFHRDLISTVITLAIHDRDSINPVNPNLSHVCPSALSEDQRPISHAQSNVPQVATSPPHRDR